LSYTRPPLLGDQQRIGLELEGSLDRGVVGRDVGLTDAAREDHDQASLEVRDRTQPDERLRNALDRHRRHHPDVRCGLRGQRAPEHQGVHHGTEHADVVGLGAADPPPVGHPPPEVVAAAHDDRDLHAEVVHREHLVGQVGQVVGVNPPSHSSRRALRR
jgi:hypothetical protein